MPKVSFIYLSILSIILFSCLQKQNSLLINNPPIEKSVELLNDLEKDPQKYLTIGQRNCDFQSIKAALPIAEKTGKTIVIMDEKHTESSIEWNGKANITGLGAYHTMIQGGETIEEATDRIFFIQKEGKVKISNLTICHGYVRQTPKRGAGIMNYGQLDLNNCIIRNNTAVYGVGIWSSGTLTINNSIICDNICYAPTMAESMSGLGCTGSGAGLKIEKPGILLMTNTTIARNKVIRAKGGGLFISCESSARLINCTITENICKNGGGGIHIRGDLELIHCTIISNQAKEGGGIHNKGRLKITATLLTDNTPNDYKKGTGGSGYYGTGEVTTNQYNFVADQSLPDTQTGKPKIKKIAHPKFQFTLIQPRYNSPLIDIIPSDKNQIKQDQFYQSRTKRNKKNPGTADIGAVEAK
ncbi:MAG: right-handed parallel beta-helix repeat-containing protein [Spirochaetes bacterium]|nr:right-handed parallel beta-helix repeat-containing protein [Spirochaetota bacterium]